jgi:undecaprenyl-diphosphatase
VRAQGAVPILAAGGVGIVVLLAMAVTSGLSDGFDQSIIEAVRAPGLFDLLSPLRAITELGSPAAVTVVALLTLLVGVLVGPWLHGLIGAIAIGLASAGNQAFKAVLARARPDVLDPIVDERGFSFPSGHALLGMTAWGILAVLVMRSRLPLNVRRGVVAVLAVLIVLIGLSRVWLGVHYPTDVLAGWTAGAVIVLLYARLTRRVSPEPAAAAVDADPGPPRSDPPAVG